MLIYKITNLLNNEIYVGQTTTTLKTRWKAHCYCARNSKKYFSKLYRSMTKHGIENFKIEEIEKTNTREELNLREIFWISFYNSIEKGLNIQKGGDSYLTHSKKTKLILSEKAKKQFEKRENHTRSKKIEKYNLKGVLLETYDSILTAAEKHNLSEATIRIAAKNIDKMYTAGGFIWNIEGHNWTFDISKINVKLNKIQKIDIKTNLVIKEYNFTKEAAKEIAGSCISTINRAIKNQKEAYGFKWKR